MRTQSLTSAFTALLIFLGMSASVSNAHEFWIQNKRINTAQGEVVSVQLMHGERFLGDIVPTDEPQINRYELIHSPSKSSLETTDLTYRHMGKTSYTKAQESGIIVYESNLYASNLQAEKFESYLREEHLEDAIQDRAERHESNTIGRELYARCAKSILTPNDQSKHADEIDHEVGLPLEIVIESVEPSAEPSAQISEGPSTKHTVTALITLNGTPVQNLRTVATSDQHPDHLIELHTDEQGRVQFDADLNAQWMITTLHIQRLSEEQSTKTDADWISYWSSITF